MFISSMALLPVSVNETKRVKTLELPFENSLLWKVKGLNGSFVAVAKYQNQERRKRGISG